MSQSSQFKILKEYNFRVLKVQGFDPIVFGCPPGVVKHFGRINEELPSKYVIPIRTFVKGKNNFDFEFILYYFLFIRLKKEKISIYCTSEQKERFMAIMEETLFGPRFKYLLHAQFRDFEVSSDFSQKDLGRFQSFLNKISANKKLFDLFDELLAAKSNDKKIHGSIKKYFESLLRNNKWVVQGSISKTADVFAKKYCLCGNLRKEMGIFALAKEEERKQFLKDNIDFFLFNKKNTVQITSSFNRNKKIKVAQSKPSVFEVYQGTKLKGSFDMRRLDNAPVPSEIEPIEKPFMGATFLGVGSGFTHKRLNSSIIVWSEGKGILVDAFNDTNETFLQYGITETDISHMILTHVHSDHDSGFIEKILSGQRVKILSTRIIYESFLRKIEGITRFPMDVVHDLVDFYEVDIKKKIKLPGFKSTFIEFDYALHSIPSLRFVLTYKKRKGVKKVLSHSGDTKFDRGKIESWYQQGTFTKRRRDEILGFVWDADMIIHEVGGGGLHTEFSSLTYLDLKIAKKLILVHQHDDPINHPYFHFASEGESKTLIKMPKPRARAGEKSLSDIILFKDLKRKQLADLYKKSKVVHLRAKELVFSQNDLGDSFYVILNGFAEVIINGKSKAIYLKGMFFGELAVSTKNPRRRATVKAISPLTLLKIPNKFYRQFNLPEIHDEFYNLGNFFNNIISPDLVASLGFGKLVHWNKDEVILNKKTPKGELYLVLTGQVEVLDKREKCIAFLTSGDIMGKSAIIARLPKSETAKALTDKVFACRLEDKQVEKMFKLFPSFYGTVYQKMKRLKSGLK